MINFSICLSYQIFSPKCQNWDKVFHALNGEVFNTFNKAFNALEKNYLLSNQQLLPQILNILTALAQ